MPLGREVRDARRPEGFGLPSRPFLFGRGAGPGLGRAVVVVLCIGF
jgi:hypothetical protein